MLLGGGGRADGKQRIQQADGDKLLVPKNRPTLSSTSGPRFVSSCARRGESPPTDFLSTGPCLLLESRLSSAFFSRSLLLSVLSSGVLPSDCVFSELVAPHYLGSHSSVIGPTQITGKTESRNFWLVCLPLHQHLEEP